MNSIYNLRKQNKGFSLVELIIAVSVGTIVAGAVGSLIAFSIRMYSNQSMNTIVQKELQMTVNQVVDSAQSASWFAFNNVGTKTEYVAFGKIITSEDDGKNYYVGELFASGDDDGSAAGRFNIYMERYSVGALEVTDEADAKSKLAGKVSSIKEEKNLLGKDANKFFIDFAKSSGGTYQNFDDTNHTFSNPIGFDFAIGFERTGFGGKEVSKEVKDEVTLRNKIKSNLYLGSQEYLPEE